MPRGPRTFLLPLLVLLLVSLASAQTMKGPVGMTGSEPGALSDAAIERWLARSPLPVAELGAMEPEAVCEALPGLFAAPPPPSGTEVVLEDRQERATDDPSILRFTYAAKFPPNRLDVVEVLLEREGEEWRVVRVGVQAPSSNGRAWLNTPQAGWGMVVLTVIVLVALARPSRLQRWLREGAAAIVAHRRLVIWTHALGWGIVMLGLWAGAQLPDACEQAVVMVLGSTLDQVGATAALQSGNVARMAAVIFYQNYFVVTVTALFGSALLLGIPAYLLAGVSFLAQSTAFGVLGLGSGLALVALLVLMATEFTAYFLVVAGGGMLVATLAREGFSALGRGYRKLVLMLPWAALLLLIGAWYEALLLAAF